MVIEETLRLFPPAWFQPREPMMEDEIGGYRIRKNSMVIVSAFLTHRHPEFWSDPERFDPTRFTEAENAKRHKFAYYPFGGGPRICIGNQFALMEAVLILATIAQRYRLENTEKPVELQPAYVLRPRNGLRMRLFRR
jgi:cytochrome P450